jgi:hypothetical protein
MCNATPKIMLQPSKKCTATSQVVALQIAKIFVTTTQKNPIATFLKLSIATSTKNNCNIKKQLQHGKISPGL